MHKLAYYINVRLTACCASCHADGFYPLAKLVNTCREPPVEVVFRLDQPDAPRMRLELEDPRYLIQRRPLAANHAGLLQAARIGRVPEISTLDIGARVDHQCQRNTKP